MSDTTARIDDTPRPADANDSTLQLGRFKSPTQESNLKSLASNLKDFLTERPVKVRGDRGPVFNMGGFGSSIGDNFKEFFQPAPRGAVNSELLVNWNESPSLWQNIRDLISPPKLPPLNVTSKPVAVKEIWSKNTQFTRVQALSIAFHVLVMVLIIVPLLPELMSPGTTKANNKYDVTTISPYLPKLAPAAKKAGGGGGQRNPTPAVRGQAPKFSWTQFSKPLAKPPENARLQMNPTLIGNPDLKVPNITAQNWGDPLSKILDGDSLGNGSGNGIGSGNGNGLGPGQQYGTGGGYPNAGTGGYGSPACLYCPQPQFSDEAVKAKYQGTVLLVAIITADGRATDIRVAKGLGLGLDEKAVEAVRTWRFRPALGPDGKPASVRQSIEVTFHLY
ncbi:MAG TPA: energy transducer TonB [Candidatus Acidoferrales bacterium]|jgi:protein TonB|nr:energy transducer TonB [Candidatus Acidoferrales bacterium]